MLRVTIVVFIVFAYVSEALCQTNPTQSFTHQDLADESGLDLSDVRDIPIIEEQMMLERRNVHADSLSGNVNDGIFQGEYRGQAVVVKVYRLNPHPQNYPATVFVNEVEAFQILSREGIAPHFFGVVRLNPHEYGIVTRRVYPSILLRDSGHLGGTIFLPELIDEFAKFKAAPQALRRVWFDRIMAIFAKLRELRASACDIHFLLEPDGSVVLIDLAELYFGLDVGHPIDRLEARWRHNLLRMVEENLLPIPDGQDLGRPALASFEF